MKVGDTVVLCNDAGYGLCSFGEKFLGVEVRIESVFNNRNGYNMVAVSLPDGDCACFLSDMVRSVYDDIDVTNNIGEITCGIQKVTRK